MEKFSHLKVMVTCNFCNCIFEDPVFLPCSKSICFKHVEEIKSRYNNSEQITCFFCSELHQIPRTGFPKNIDVAKLIEHDYHRIDYGLTHKSATQLCETLEMNIYDYETLWKEPETYINDYFRKLINQIDLRREECKLSIEKCHEQRLEEIQNYRIDCLSQLDKNSSTENELIQELRNNLQFWRKKLTIPELSSKEFSFENIEKNVGSSVQTLSSKVNDYKENLLNKSEYIFHFSELVLPNEAFGQIKVEKKV